MKKMQILKKKEISALEASTELFDFEKEIFQHIEHFPINKLSTFAEQIYHKLVKLAKYFLSMFEMNIHENFIA